MLFSATGEPSFCRCQTDTDNACTCPDFTPDENPQVCDTCDHRREWHLPPVNLDRENAEKAKASFGFALERCKSQLANQAACPCPCFVADGDNPNELPKTVCSLCGHKAGWHKWKDSTLPQTMTPETPSATTLDFPHRQGSPVRGMLHAFPSTLGLTTGQPSAYQPTYQSLNTSGDSLGGFTDNSRSPPAFHSPMSSYGGSRGMILRGPDQYDHNQRHRVLSDPRFDQNQHLPRDVPYPAPPSVDPAPSSSGHTHSNHTQATSSSRSDNFSPHPDEYPDEAPPPFPSTSSNTNFIDEKRELISQLSRIREQKRREHLAQAPPEPTVPLRTRELSVSTNIRAGSISESTNNHAAYIPSRTTSPATEIRNAAPSIHRTVSPAVSLPDPGPDPGPSHTTPHTRNVSLPVNSSPSNTSQPIRTASLASDLFKGRRAAEDRWFLPPSPSVYSPDSPVDTSRHTSLNAPQSSRSQPDRPQETIPPVPPVPPVPQLAPLQSTNLWTPGTTSPMQILSPGLNSAYPSRRVLPGGRTDHNPSFSDSSTYSVSPPLQSPGPMASLTETLSRHVNISPNTQDRPLPEISTSDLGHRHGDESDSTGHSGYQSLPPRPSAPRPSSILSTDQSSGRAEGTSVREETPVWQSYTLKNDVATLYVSPPFESRRFKPGDLFKFKFEFGPRFGLGNFTDIHVEMLGHSYVQNEPPDEHDFLHLLASIHPSQLTSGSGNTVQVSSDHAQRTFEWEMRLPFYQNCTCREDPLPLPPSYGHPSFKCDYCIKVVLKKKRAVLGAKSEKTEFPFQVDVPFNELPIVSESPVTPTTIDGDWRTITGNKVIRVENQQASIVGQEFSWQIVHPSSNPNMIKIPYRMSLCFGSVGKSQYFNEDALEKFGEILRVSLSRKIMISRNPQNRKQLRSLPILMVTFKDRREIKGHVLDIKGRTYWRIGGTLELDRRSIKNLTTCSILIRFILSAKAPATCGFSHEIELFARNIVLEVPSKESHRLERTSSSISRNSGQGQPSLSPISRFHTLNSTRSIPTLSHYPSRTDVNSTTDTGSLRNTVPTVREEGPREFVPSHYLNLENPAPAYDNGTWGDSVQRQLDRAM